MTIDDHYTYLLRTCRWSGNEKPRSWAGCRLRNSGPRRARTDDPRIKSPLLYRLSYRPHCTLNYWAFTLFIRCGRNRIGDLRPLRQTLNQSRDSFSRETGYEGKAPKPEAIRQQRCRSRLNPKNRRRSKRPVQTKHTRQMQTTMKSLPLVESILHAPNDVTNDPCLRSRVTNYALNVRKPQHMYLAMEQPIT